MSDLSCGKRKGKYICRLLVGHAKGHSWSPADAPIPERETRAQRMKIMGAQPGDEITILSRTRITITTPDPDAAVSRLRHATSIARLPMAYGFAKPEDAIAATQGEQRSYTVIFDFSDQEEA